MTIRAYNYTPSPEGMGLFAGEVAELSRPRKSVPLFLSFVSCVGFFGMLVMAAVMIGAL